jgi:hypothetical protein
MNTVPCIVPYEPGIFFPTVVLQPTPEQQVISQQQQTINQLWQINGQQQQTIEQLRQELAQANQRVAQIEQLSVKQQQELAHAKGVITRYDKEQCQALWEARVQQKAKRQKKLRSPVQAQNDRCSHDEKPKEKPLVCSGDRAPSGGQTLEDRFKLLLSAARSKDSLN